MSDQKSFKKLLSIVGPTAVGKTSFALKLIDYLELQGNADPKAGYDIISADSRQVYKDIAIISGADVPPEFDRQGDTFVNGNISLHGIGILNYEEDWSVSQFKDFAREILKKSWESDRMPIIVGGTGLYHQHLFNPSPILDIKPDPKLRSQLEKKTLPELQVNLAKINQKKLESMNRSDRNNPVRLIRAIEIEISKESKKNDQPHSNKIFDQKLPNFALKTIGLRDELETIREKIEKRVKERFDFGAILEVEALQEKVGQFGPNRQILTATGVREIQAYLDGQIDKQECIEKWSLREFQYAKRQLTWWKNRPNIDWFDISDPDWLSKTLLNTSKFLIY